MLGAEIYSMGNEGGDGKNSMSWMKSMRTLRALRPLRAVSRWEGMRVRIFVQLELS